MQSLDAVLQWLAEHEAALSAIVAIIAIAGISLGFFRVILRIAFPGRHATASDKDAASPASTSQVVSEVTLDNGAAAPSIHDDHVSLAVMLFQALSKNEDDEFIASGIASEVIALVTPIPDIRVSSRSSAFGWRSGETDVETTRQQINADFALTGSLRRAGDKIRVIAQLIETKTDAQVWTETYDRELEDLFEVQHDIAGSIVGAILGEVKLAEALLANKIPNHQLDAWGLMQKAYHFWLTNFSLERMLQACEYLRQAIKLDPDYANAQAALAMLLAQQMTSRVCQDYDDVALEAKRLIEAAYARAPNDVEILENAGVVWQNLGQGDRAERAFRHALKIAPLNLITRGYLAMTLSFVKGKVGAEEAREILKSNIQTAPAHPSLPYWHYFYAVAEQCLGNHQAAIEHAQHSLQGQPGWVHNYFVIANAQCELGDAQAAAQAIEQANAINPFLTAPLYAENVNRITGDPELSEAFVGGILRHNLAQT